MAREHSLGARLEDGAEPDPRSVGPEAHAPLRNQPSSDAASSSGVSRVGAGACGSYSARMPEVGIERIRRAAGSALALIFTSVIASGLASAALAQAPDLALQFKDTPISEVVRSIATTTGTPFIYDERLTGRVTISVAQRVSRAEALEILNAALRMKGFAAFPTAQGPYRILPLQEAGALSPFTSLTRDGEKAVTTLVRLHETRPSDMAATLEPITGDSAVVVPLDDSHTLIVASSESRVQRLLGLVRSLDRASGLELALVRIRYRSVEEVEALARSTFEGRGLVPSRLEFLSDARTNTLIVEGHSEDLSEVRAFVRKVDRPVAGRGGVHVVRVLNTDPVNLAEALQQAAPPTPKGGDEDDPPPVVLSDYSIVVDTPTRSLLIVSDAETFRVLADLVAELDVVPPIVSIDAYVVEIETPHTLDVAVDAVIPLTTPRNKDDTVAVIRTITNGAGQTLETRPLTEAGLLRFSKRPFQIMDVNAAGEKVVVGESPNWTVDVRGDEALVNTRMLMRPHMIVSSGEEQEIFAGNNVPIPVAASTGTAPTTETSALTLRTDIERQDVGVRFRVKPTVGKEGGLMLDLEVETTAVTRATLGDVEEVGPTLLLRRVESTVRLVDGQVAVVGARGEPRELVIERGVPFLKDIPFLGNLFRATREEIVEAHTVVAVQARVLRSPEELLEDTIRRRLAFERHRVGLSALEGASEDPYALLVTSRPGQAEAAQIARSLAASGHDARVVPWEADAGLRYDVYVLGFAELTDASEAGLELLVDGWTPEVVTLPAFFD
jgi:general secretion pathway protein D